jgi:hypothetical protein
VWKATVSVPAGTAFQYKYIVSDDLAMHSPSTHVVNRLQKNEGNGTVRCCLFAFVLLLTHRLQIVWESDPNRSATAPTSGTQTLSGSWQT